MLEIDLVEMVKKETSIDEEFHKENEADQPQVTSSIQFGTLPAQALINMPSYFLFHISHAK